MKNPSREAARQVRVALDALKTPSVENADVIDVPELGVRIRIAEAVVRDGGVYAVYDVGSRNDLDAEGICVLAVGYGDDVNRAFGEAAFQWATGVFTVVRHWLDPARHTCFVDDLHLLVRDEESGEEFGWRVHSGPVLSRVFAPDDVSFEVEPLDVFRALFDHVHGRAAHRALFWIEAFVVRYPDGRLVSTCRLRNEDWLEGENALVSWAAGWKETGGTMVSVRQFLLFEPLEPGKLPNKNELDATLARLRPAAKPWWKRLFWR